MNSGVKENIIVEDKNIYLWGIIIFLSALILRLVFLFEFKSIPLFDTPIMDMKYFNDWAISFINGTGAGPAPYFKAPLYPIFVGMVYSVFGDGPWPIRIVQTVLGSLSSLLTFLIGVRIFKKKVGITAGFITAFYSVLIIYDAQLLVPTLVIFLNLLGVYFIVTGMQSKKIILFLLGGISLGLSAIARPTILLFVVAAFILMIWVYFRVSRQLNIKSIILFVIGVLLAIAPVTVRNFVKSGEVVLIGAYAGINLYIGNNLQSDGITARLPGTGLDWWGEGEMEEAIRIAEEDVGHTLTASERSQYWENRAIDEIKNNPGFFFSNLWRKFIFFIGGVELYNNFDIYYVAYQTTMMKFLLWKDFLFFPWGIILPLAAMGVVLIKRWSNERVLILLFLISYIPTLLLFFVTSRYRLPMVPFLVLFASYLIIEGYKRLKECSISRKIVSIVVMIVLLVVSQGDFYNLSRGSNAQGHQMMASIYHHNGDDVKAEEYYRKALFADANLPNSNNDLGVFLMNRGEYTEAIELFNHAIKYEPGEYIFHQNLGDAYLNSGRIDDAMGKYKYVLTLNPESYLAFHNLGQCWFKKNAPDSAIKYFSMAIDLKAEIPDAYFSLGYVYHALSDIDSAQYYVSQAVKFDPDYADANFSLGFIFMQQNEIDSAKVYFEKYLTLLNANDHLKIRAQDLLDSLLAL